MAENQKFPNSGKILKKIFVLAFTSVTILTSAAGCTIPGLQNQNQNGLTKGVLKRDPSLGDTFGKINTVDLLNGSQNKQGLTNINTLEIDQIGQDELYLLTVNNGLFFTNNGGRSWKRKYVYPVNPNDENLQTQITRNNSIINTDLAIDESNNKVIFIAGIEAGVAKIFRSVNSGNVFEEVYSEVDNNTSIKSIAIDPTNNANVFALLDSGVMLKSSDSGQTWSKSRDFNNAAISVGFVKEFDNIFYVLLQNKGLFTSKDLGVTWEEMILQRNLTPIEESKKNSFNDIFITKNFGSFESIQPIKANKNSWIVTADKQLWITDNLANPFNKLVLPFEDDKYDFAAVATDPIQGKNRILASIDNNLFESNNGGVTWSTRNKEGLGSGVGSINQIHLDENDPKIIYLALR